MPLGWIPLIFILASVVAYWLLGRLLPANKASQELPPLDVTSVSVRGRIDEALGPHIPTSLYEWLDRRLSIAGYPWGLRVASFLIIWGSMIFFGVIAYLVIRTEPFRLAGAIGWNAMLILGAFPYIFLYRRGTKRQRRIERALPDMLDRLDIAMNVGLPFTKGVEKVLQYMPHGPLHDEFSQAMNQLYYGKSLEQAFRAVASRVRVPEVTSFVSAVVQAHRLGVDISQVIRIQAEAIRMQHRQHSEEEAAKAGTKLVFPLILVTLPMVFILLLGPILISILVR